MGTYGVQLKGVLPWLVRWARRDSTRDFKFFFVPASYILYLSDFCRFLLCTCGWERGGRGSAGEGEGARERGIECILYGYT